eukprot:gene1165-biopygen7723
MADGCAPRDVKKNGRFRQGCKPSLPPGLQALPSARAASHPFRQGCKPSLSPGLQAIPSARAASQDALVRVVEIGRAQRPALAKIDRSKHLVFSKKIGGSGDAIAGKEG